MYTLSLLEIGMIGFLAQIMDGTLGIGLSNLVNIEKEQFKFLKAKLEEWMNRPKPNVVSFKRPLEEETKEKLRRLGYVQ